MSDRLLDRIALLLAKAESTDSEHERDALISKAQELATTNAISLEVARQRQQDRSKREVPVQKGVRLFPSGDRSKGKSSFIYLYDAIARNNDIKMNIYHDSSGVILFGFPSDIEVAEMLYASLSVQMVAAANAWLATGEYKSETVFSHSSWQNKPVSAITARLNFYEGFVSAIGTRLRQARKDAVAAAVIEPAAEFEPMGDDSAPLVPVTGDIVLRDKQVEVADFYKAESRARGSYRGGGAGAFSATASGAGRTAGERASLGGSRAALGGAAKAIA